MPTIVISRLTKHFGRKDALRGIDLEVSSGERLAIVGPSGCGKTTLLRIIAGLETADAGSFMLAGRSANDLLPSERHLGMVLQGENLLPQLTVRDNLTLSLKLKGVPTSDRQSRLIDVAQQLDLAHLLDRLPHELSGGQARRVAVGRLLVARPSIWLLDEPLVNLDPAHRAAVRRTICQQQQQCGATMLYVTHDQGEAMSVGDRVAVMAEGTFQMVDTPAKLYRAPVNRWVASFFGDPPMNLIEVAIQDQIVSCLGAPFQLEHAPSDGTYVCGFRPEAVQLDAGEVRWSGTVTSDEFQGDAIIVRIAVDREVITAKLPVTDAPTTGEQITVGVDRRSLHLFDVQPPGRRLAGPDTPHDD